MKISKRLKHIPIKKILRTSLILIAMAALLATMAAPFLI